MAAWTSILTSIFLLAASMCSNHCEVVSLKSHACCPHKKAPVQADSSCTHPKETVQPAYFAVDCEAAPQSVAETLPLAEFVLVAADSPPPSPPIAVSILRI